MSALKRGILGVVGSRVFSTGRVQNVEVISPHYRLITIRTEALRGAVWPAAAKMKINPGNWDTRTYTPLSHDVSVGEFQILAFVHGEGPGAAWARSVKPGDSAQTAPARSSLDVQDVSQPMVFFGDETSFAAAASLQGQRAAGARSLSVFEVFSAIEARAVVDRLGLHDVELVAKTHDGAHLPPLAQRLSASLLRLDTTQLVLTGNAFSIQAVRKALRQQERVTPRYHVRAYWTPGKAGLD